MCWWIVLLPLTALWGLAISWPPWCVMTAISLSTLIILKAATLREFVRSCPSHGRNGTYATDGTNGTYDKASTGYPLSAVGVLAWFFAWPGLNAREFFSPAPAQADRVRFSDWVAAVAKTVIGLVLLTVIAPRVVPYQAFVGVWLAMVGIVMLLHFGTFHLLALVWRRAGRNVRPIMCQPLLATSVAEFWTHRWNLAFRDFANVFVMRPLARRWNGTVAMWGCFAFSGLVHELAISVPARAGYGLPTAYFLLQAAGVSVERTAWGKRIGLRDGWRGWIFACLWIAPAALFLFHPPFVYRVILPLIGR